MTVTFCGHSDAPCTDELRLWLTETVEGLIGQGADKFYLGGYGSFDSMAASTVWDMKKKYPHIQSVLVIPYLDKQVDSSRYDYTTYPPLESVPRRYAITHRNRWMVDNSDAIVAYVRHGWGGAAQILERAKKKGLIVINWKTEKQ